MDSVFANLPAGGRLPSARARQLRSRRIVIGLFVVLGLFSIVLAPVASAAGLATVNSTSDAPDNNPGDGVCDTGQNNAAGAAECTLRAAIEEANADNDPTRVHFNIPAADPNHAAGVWTISPLSNLPDANFETDFDGATQPGTGATPSIALDGSLAGSARGLHLATSAQGSEVKNLAIGNFERSGLEVSSRSALITGNVIGLDASGTSPAPNGLAGIFIFGSPDDVNVGGFNSSSGNVISGNVGPGIEVHGGSNGLRINNNFIGTDVTGTVDFGNGAHGISLIAASNAEIGNNGPNVISGNALNGIVSDSHNSLEIQRNIIGLSIDQLVALPNDASGIELIAGGGAEIGRTTQPNIISANGVDGITVSGGDSSVIEGNFIGVNQSGAAFGNGEYGVFVDAADYWHVEQNEIANNGLDGVAAPNPNGLVGVVNNRFVNNGGLAFDLGDDGVTINDPGDADSGTNGLLNYPVIDSISSSGEVFHTLDVPAGSYTVYIFRNPSGPDPSGHGEAEELVWRGSRSLNGNGPQSFNTGGLGVSVSDNLSLQLVRNGSQEISSELSPVFGLPQPGLVNSTGDSGDTNPGDGVCTTGGLNSEGNTECTLRAAIEETNALAGADDITFDIPVSDSGHAGGVFTITPSNTLPSLADEVFIDGRTQQGWNGDPVIVLDGSTAGNVVGLMFTPTASTSQLHGFSIVNFGGGVQILGADDVGVVQNFVGIFPDGSPGPIVGDGIRAHGGAERVVIEENFVGNTGGTGVRLVATGVSGEIADNIIGENPSGQPAPTSGPSIGIVGGASDVVIDNNVLTNSLVNSLLIDDASNVVVTNNEISAFGGDGIAIDNGSTDIVIGTSGGGNLIYGGAFDGIQVQATGSGLIIQDNVIGIDDSSNPDGVGNDGIQIQDVTDPVLIFDNTIANSAFRGIKVERSDAVQITENSLFLNNVEIDLDGDGVSINDAGDGDAGANDLLNKPVIQTVTNLGGGNVSLVIDIDVPVVGTYELELFESSAIGPNGAGYAENYVDTFSVPAGSAQLTLGTMLNAGSYITATLTETSLGITSELSDPELVLPPPANSVVAIPNQTDFENDFVSLQIDATPGGTAPLTYSAPNLPDGLTISLTGEISGTLSFDSAGIYPIVVTVSSSDAASVTTKFDWEVINENRPPVIDPVPDQNTEVGESVSLFPTFLDEDNDSVTWTQSGLPFGLVINPTTGEITGSPLSPEVRVVSLEALDPSGATHVVSFTWTVTDPPPTSPTTVAPTTTTTPVTSTTVAPVTTTTVPPTTAAPTTTVAPVTAPVVAPTTEAPATTVAPTTTTSTTTTTTTPPPPPPPALAFTMIDAVDDMFVSSTDQEVLDVLDNDSFGDAPRIVSVTQPDVGSVSVLGTQLVLDLPESYAGELTFSYTFTDASGVNVTADVRVSSANVLGSVRGLEDTSTSTAGVADSVGRVASRFVGLLEVRLSTLQVVVLAPLPLFLGLVWLGVRRRERLLSITDVEHFDTAQVAGAGGAFAVRHDALVWTSGRSRRGANGGSQLFVETLAGTRGWISADQLDDTRF